MGGPGQMPNSHMQMSGPGPMNGLGQKNDSTSSHSSPMGQSEMTGPGQPGMNQSRMPNGQYSQSGSSMPYGPTSSQYGPGQQGYQHSYPPTSAPGMTAGSQQKSGGQSKNG